MKDLWFPVAVTSSMKVHFYLNDRTDVIIGGNPPSAIESVIYLYDNNFLKTYGCGTKHLCRLLIAHHGGKRGQDFISTTPGRPS